MRDLAGKVAVVTGAASGLGRALALRCAGERMHLVLADVDERALEETARSAGGPGADSLRVKCDVSRPEDVEALAERTWERFGSAGLLFNNAGVATAGPAWTATLEDWRWVLGVNLMGVIHGIRSFVPRMLRQGSEGHVVNTASASGLLSVPGQSVYCVSKHAVVTLSECLHHDLRAANAAIGVSVLCPAYFNTGIADSARNRPAELAPTNPLAAQYEERMRRAVRSGKLSAEDVAMAALEAVKSGRFYVLTHPRIKPAVEARMKDILEERTPTNPMP
ncbi:MAG TPA: SDR family NAD(P)-dependent oxidoreductase [Anaeromyxobacter sp.]